jgi:hypothetical protein
VGLRREGLEFEVARTRNLVQRAIVVVVVVSLMSSSPSSAAPLSTTMTTMHIIMPLSTMAYHAGATHVLCGTDFWQFGDSLEVQL